jgi:predicted ribosome quality control (RQC) complex YloA/Tae2 family protein
VHNTFFFIRQISQSLQSQLKGHSVVSCFSQSREELILEFNNSSHSFFIKTSVSSGFSCLSFPHQFARARKNSVDLFPEIILKKVVSITQYEHERCLTIHLEDGWGLLFKMHGNRSNVLLIKDDRVYSLFRNNLPADRTIIPSQLHRSFHLQKEIFEQNLHHLDSYCFTFNKKIWKQLYSSGFLEKSTDEKWDWFIHFYHQLLNPSAYYLISKDGHIHLSLFKDQVTMGEYTDALDASTSFYQAYSTTELLFREKNSLVKGLQEKIQGCQTYITKGVEKIKELENDKRYQQWADLIMAHLHQIQEGMEKIQVMDFYHDNLPLEIRLKPSLSGQKNAEVYYRKSKNLHIEITKLKEAIEKKQKELDKFSDELKRAENASQLKEVRQLTPLSPKAHTPDKILPYHEFEFKQFRIWVGRNANQNDILTFKHGHKEDLWLHAKDVPGSHVLIKFQANKPFPKDVIERAAELAAYNSKRKTDSLCPVVVTPRKFVRKRKGDPAGAVVVEKETVILVEPKL